MSKRINNEITLEEIARLMDVDCPGDYWERIDDSSNWCEHRKYFLTENKDKYNTFEELEEAADEYANNHTDLEQSESYDKYCDALLFAFRDLLSKHKLNLEEKLVSYKNRKYGKYIKFFVVPFVNGSWRDACGELIETINGVGYFYFSSVKHFLDSGPYSPKEAVMSHLHWMKRHHEVYGDPSPRSLIDRRMR